MSDLSEAGLPHVITASFSLEGKNGNLLPAANDEHESWIGVALDN